MYFAFCIFHLPDNVKSPPTRTDEYFKRLARAFDVNENKLKRQHEDHFYLATRIKIAEKVNTGDAWEKAVAHTSSHGETRAKHPADGLINVLKRYRLAHTI